MALDQNNRDIGDISWTEVIKGLNSQVKEVKNFTNKFEEKLSNLASENANKKELFKDLLKPVLDKLKKQNTSQEDIISLLEKAVVLLEGQNGKGGKRKDKQEKDDTVKEHKDNIIEHKDNERAHADAIKLQKAFGNKGNFFGGITSFLSKMWSKNTSINDKNSASFEKAMEKSLEKIVKSMEKGDKKGAFNEAKKIAELEKTSKTVMGRMRDTLSNLRTIADELDRFAPHNFGIGEKYDASARLQEIIKENKEFTKDIHGIMNQSFGSRGSLLRRSPNDLASAPNYRREQDEDLARYYQGMYDLARDFNVTGQRSTVIQKLWLNNLRRGIRSYSQLNALTRQGAQLGTMIDADAEHTTEELADWNQYLGLSVRQTAALSHNMVSVSLATGLTGDRLLAATRSAKQFAETMRDAGTLTDQSARSLIQMSAVSSTRGTENLITRLRTAMLSSTGFFDADRETTSFLTAGAANSRDRNEILNALVNGNIMNNPRLGLSLAGGMRQTAMNITGGRNVNQLNPTELMAANQVARAFGQTGIQAMFLAADTMRDSFEDSADQMARLNQELARGNLTRREQVDLETRIRALQRRQVQEGMTRAFSNLGDVRGGNMSQGDLTTNVNAIVAGLQANVNNLTGPGMETHRQNMQTRIAEINRLRGDGNLSPAQFSTLNAYIEETMGQNAVIERLLQSSESENQVNTQIAVQQRMETSVAEILGWIQRNTPYQASLLNTGIGITQMILGATYGILNSLLSIGESLRAIGGFGGLVSSIVGGLVVGIARAIPWVAIAVGIYKLIDTMSNLYEAQGRLTMAVQNSNRLANKQSMDRAAMSASIRRGEEDEHYRNEFTQGHHMLRDIDLNSQILAQQEAARNLHGLTEEEIQSGTQRRNNWGGYNLNEGEFATRRNNVRGARDQLEFLRTEANRRWQVSQQAGGANFEQLSRESTIIDLPQMLERANLGNNAAIRALSSAGIDFNALRTRTLAANPNAQGMELSRLMTESLRRDQPNLFNLSAAPNVTPAGPNQTNANGGAPAGQNWQNALNMANNTPYGYGIFANNGGVPGMPPMPPVGTPPPGYPPIPTIPGMPPGMMPPTIPVPIPGLSPFGLPGGMINIPTTSTIPGLPTGTPTANTTSPVNPLNNYANAQQAVDRNMGDINNSTKLTAQETHEIKMLMEKLVKLFPSMAQNRGNDNMMAANPNYYTWNTPIS